MKDLWETNLAPRHGQNTVSATALSALLVVLAAVFLGIGEGNHFYHSDSYDRMEHSAKTLTLAENLSAEKPVLFKYLRRLPDGRLGYGLYNRFPIGGMLLIKLAIAPFEGDLSAQILAARVLMLAFFCAAALAAYLALCRLVGGRAVPFAATLLAFSSYHMLDMSDVVTTEGVVDLFGVLLVFHGLVVFAQEGRFGQLAAKTCVALLLGWHAYALLAPYLALGLAAELVEAGRQARAGWRADGATKTRRGLRLLRTLAAQAARSRHTRIGLVALLAGTIVLGCNFGAEYALLGEERPFAELPSVRSALSRAGIRPPVNYPQTDWAAFLPWQFHRVGIMLLPYGLSSPGEHAWHEAAWRASGASPLAGVGVLATVACFGALLFAPAFRGRRALWTALALSGFCWALPMRYNTAWAGHDYETIHFVGIPLALFTALLLGALGALGGRTRWRGRVAAGCAVLGALVFVASSVRMGAVGRDADESARRRAVMGEFERIRATTRGKDVLVLHHYVMDPVVDWDSFTYFMAGTVPRLPRTLADARRLEAGGEVDYVLGFMRRACSTNPARDWRQPPGGEAETCEATGNAANVRALTPGHRFAFLYAPGGVAEAVLAGWRRDYAAAAAGEPLARGGFDVHLLERHDQRRLYYLKKPCRADDTTGMFFLDTEPTAKRDLAPLRPDGFNRMEFSFDRLGVRFENRCLIDVPLPAHPVSTVSTGRRAPAGEGSWQVAFRADVDALRRAHARTRTLAPAARGAFDLHLHAGALIYTREPCSEADVAARFFLHVAAPAEALPAHRRAHGIDNLDFDFRAEGVIFDGKCVAEVPLPDYAIRNVTTGQFGPHGKIWSAHVDMADR